MNFTQIKETCLYVDDLDKTEDFYLNVLELPLISRVDGRHIFFRCGSSVLLCFLNKATIAEDSLPPHYSIGKLHLAFEVTEEEYDETQRKLEAKGVLVTHVHEWGGGRYKSFYFEDPDGHVLEVVPMGMWES